MRVCTTCGFVSVFSVGYPSTPEWLEPVLWPRTWWCELMWEQQQQQQQPLPWPCMVEFNVKRWSTYEIWRKELPGTWYTTCDCCDVQCPNSLSDGDRSHAGSFLRLVHGIRSIFHFVSCLKTRFLYDRSLSSCVIFRLGFCGFRVSVFVVCFSACFMAHDSFPSLQISLIRLICLWFSFIGLILLSHFASLLLDGSVCVTNQRLPWY